MENKFISAFLSVVLLYSCSNTPKVPLYFGTFSYHIADSEASFRKEEPRSLYPSGSLFSVDLRQDNVLDMTVLYDWGKDQLCISALSIPYRSDKNQVCLDSGIYPLTVSFGKITYNVEWNLSGTFEVAIPQTECSIRVEGELPGEYFSLRISELLDSSSAFSYDSPVNPHIDWRITSYDAVLNASPDKVTVCIEMWDGTSSEVVLNAYEQITLPVYDETDPLFKPSPSTCETMEVQYPDNSCHSIRNPFDLVVSDTMLREDHIISNFMIFYSVPLLTFEIPDLRHIS